MMRQKSVLFIPDNSCIQVALKDKNNFNKKLIFFVTSRLIDSIYSLNFYIEMIKDK